MQINLSFNSVEELDAFVCRHYGRIGLEWGAKESIKAAVAVKETPKKETKTEKKEEPVKAPKGVDTEVPEAFKGIADEPKAEEPKAEAPAPAKPALSADASEMKIFLSGISKSGKREEVKALLQSYGVEKFAEFAAKYPDKLDELRAKAEAL